MKQFLRVLINAAVANTAAFFLWSAVSFWLYLETKSVLILSLLSGTYMVLVTLSSMIFGTLVDKHHKKRVMIAASIATIVLFAVSIASYFYFGHDAIIDLSSLPFWIFSLSVLFGALAGNLRGIALSTTVSILVPKEDYAKANGLVGTIQGFGMIANTVISGLVIGRLGMDWALYIAMAVTILTLIHLFFVPIPEDELEHDPEVQNKQIDFHGALKTIRAVPGLMALILFTTINNFIGGVVMVLLDPYGLEMFSVEVWGIILGLTVSGFIFGGLYISKKGLGQKPLRTLLRAYVILSLICLLFTIREWSWLFISGIFLYMFFVPFVEGAEQTIIQTIVPKSKQGRVFGFAQTVESGSTPISSYLIGPFAQFFIIPFMETDAGRQTFGWLVGEGHSRGIALTFVIAGAIMLIVSFLAFRTRAYHLLSDSFDKNKVRESEVFYNADIKED